MERLVIESALDIRGVNDTRGVIGGASSGGESMNAGGGRSSFCSSSAEISFEGITGMMLDLLAADHGGGDSEVIPGASCCVGGGEGGRACDLLEF